MLIRSQNRRELVKVIRVSISKPISIDGRVKIIGYYRPITLMFNNSVTLGIYTFEEAMNEIDNIEKFFNKYPESVYNMKISE